MSRYIDADALIKEIEQDIDDGGLTERYVFYRINEAPSIDIVRCGECKWSYIDHRDDTMWCAIHLSHYYVNADYFCNYGERRTDGDI